MIFGLICCTLTARKHDFKLEYKRHQLKTSIAAKSSKLLTEEIPEDNYNYIQQLQAYEAALNCTQPKKKISSHFPFKYYLLSKLQTASTENDTKHRQRSKLLTAEMPEGNLKELDSRPGGTFFKKKEIMPFWWARSASMIWICI